MGTVICQITNEYQW